MNKMAGPRIMSPASNNGKPFSRNENVKTASLKLHVLS
jgi:hypothetical protein